MYPDNLEDRFKAPENWQTGNFEHNGHSIHYGYALADTPKGTIVLVSGLSEFTEKYYEVAKELLSRGLSVFTMDWYGQGRSSRPLSNPQKRYSEGFDQDASDLGYFISNIVKDKTNHQTLILLAHSMGGNISMRYVINNPATFDAIAVSSPMFGILALQPFPDWLVRTLLCLLQPFSKFYVAGGHDWTPEIRGSKDNDIFSSDPLRKTLHNAWCLHAPVLQVGSPTFGWVKAATESCRILLSHDYSSFKTPCLFATGGQEELVDRDKIRQMAEKIPHATLLEHPKAKHEILMETDDVRNAFWDAFDKMLEDHKILT